MNKKRWVKNIIKRPLYFSLFYMRFFDLFLKILARVRHQYPCVILVYHRIVNDSSRYLNKGPAIHHHIKHFEREIPYLKIKFQILSMDEVIDHIKSNRSFKRPSVAITFDDGYLDNYTLAYPVLKKHAVTATIYLTTNLVGTLNRTWIDQIERILLNTKKVQFKLPGLFGGKGLPIKTKKEKEQANEKIAESLKKKTGGELAQLMRELFEIMEVDDNQTRNCEGRMMLNWDEVQIMAKNGITIGSHSHNHPILSRMPIQKAKEEIFKSKKVIEENLGIKVKHFAFPNGKEEDFNEELGDYCREIGFESIASVIYGTNGASKGNTLVLKRVVAVSPVWMLAGELVRLFMRIN